jgi:hypothetical protein
MLALASGQHPNMPVTYWAHVDPDGQDETPSVQSTWIRSPPAGLELMAAAASATAGGAAAIVGAAGAVWGVAQAGPAHPTSHEHCAATTPLAPPTTPNPWQNVPSAVVLQPAPFSAGK